LGLVGGGDIRVGGIERKRKVEEEVDK